MILITKTLFQVDINLRAVRIHISKQAVSQAIYNSKLNSPHIPNYAEYPTENKQGLIQ